MSSPSPATQRKNPRRGRRADFVRPAHVDPNHHVPWRAWDVRQACPLRPAIVYMALCSMKPVPLPPGPDGKPRGSIVTNISNRSIRRATAKFMPSMTSALPAEPMPLRTTAHCIEHLIEKGFIDRWNTERSKNSPFGSSYRIVPWEEVLERWAADPTIATAEGTRRGFYVWGKGKWHLTPQDVIDWQVDANKADADPHAHAPLAAIEQPSAAPIPAPAPQAVRKPRMTVQEELIEDTGVVHRAILDTGVPAEPEHAAALLALARQVEASIPAASIASLIHGLFESYLARERKKNPYNIRIIWTVGWFVNDLPGAVHRWKHDRDMAEQATRAAR